MPNATLKFALTNIHFHTPAEHRVDASKKSIEAHFVHSLVERHEQIHAGLNKLVIGVIFDATTEWESPFLKSLGLDDLRVVLVPVIVPG